MRQRSTLCCMVHIPRRAWVRGPGGNDMMFLLRRHMSFYLAALGGLPAFGAAFYLDRPLAPIIGANCFFLLFLALSLTTLPHLTAGFLKKNAASTDQPTWIIFLVTIATVVVAVVSLFMLVNQKPQASLFSLISTLASVPLGWATIHMMTALHYAHVYWQPEQATSASTPGHKGGLEFPGTKAPCGWDFAYYAFIIGMCAQTSDTNVTTTTMRRITLAHSVLAFFFNTVLVAAAVNAAVALGG